MQLKGGLGNLMFQIATLYSLSIDRKQDFCILNKIYSPITQREEETFWMETIFMPIKKVIIKPSLIRMMYKEKEFKYRDIPDLKRSMELNGYFQSDKYFNHNKDKIIDLFLLYKKQIQKVLDYKFGDTRKSISFHIRRGDYVNHQQFHVIQIDDYYRNAINKLMTILNFNSVEELNREYRFIIFSDDIPWCKTSSLFSKFDNLKFMENNRAIEDLYLMSMCDHHIIANSTFSWWGAYLNKNTDKIVICPKKWFNPSYIPESQWQDIYCEKWIKC